LFDAEYADLDQLLAEIPAEDLIPETYDIALPGGKRVKCRTPKRYSFFTQFKRELRSFWDHCNSDDVHPEWLPFLPQDFDEAWAAYMIHYNSVEPTKFNQLQALQIVSRRPDVAVSLVRQIQEMSEKAVAAVSSKETEEAKKDSWQTDGTELATSSAETLSERIPSN
jgi:hypothetical protein